VEWLAFRGSAWYILLRRDRRAGWPGKNCEAPEKKSVAGLSAYMGQERRKACGFKISTTNEETQMKKILAVVLFTAVAASLSFAAADTFNGWVTDAKCAPKVNADCAKKCAEKGEAMVLVTADKKVIAVSNPDTLKDHAGHHVTVTGEMKDGKLNVSKVEMAKDQDPPK
jgi:hypothetical protein